MRELMLKEQVTISITAPPGTSAKELEEGAKELFDLLDQLHKSLGGKGLVMTDLETKEQKEN